MTDFTNPVHVGQTSDMQPVPAATAQAVAAAVRGHEAGRNGDLRDVVVVDPSSGVSPAPVYGSSTEAARQVQGIPEVNRTPLATSSDTSVTKSNGAATKQAHHMHVEDLTGAASLGKSHSLSKVANDTGMRVQYKGIRPDSRKVGRITEFFARAATLSSPSNALNWAWGIVFTILFPALLGIIWYGCIPVGAPITGGSYGDKAVWVFIVHPLAMALLSYLLLSLFLTAIEESHPWRPLASYMHIVVIVYVAQVIFPGLVVFFDRPFVLLALPSIFFVFVITLVGLRLTPHNWLDNDAKRYHTTLIVFTKCSVVMMVHMGILAGYMIVNAEANGVGQGFLTVAINLIAFIAKKFLLAYTDRIAIETAMLIAGLWLENLTDLFITLAFPTAEKFGATFAIIFGVRIIEDLAYLVFQTMLWFRFRVWIKRKFKKSMGGAILEDLPEHQDDRGHSEVRPGYQRRQLRFLVMKLLSQVQSYIFFLVVVPVLRFGPNKRRFPYADPRIINNQEVVELPDTLLDTDLQTLPWSHFQRAMVFAVFSIFATLIAGLGMWMFMHRYHRQIIVQVRQNYNTVVVQAAHYGLVLSILLVNALIATSFLQIYYRVYFA